jgi:hypothetical protein
LTKANKAREETVASVYRNFINYTLNAELPRPFHVKFIHWDMKAKKANKAKRYEIDMLEIAEELVGKTSFFSSIPFSELELSER